MIVSKINNYYEIRIINSNIDIYNPIELQDITTKIYKYISKNNKLNKLIIIDIYSDNNYGIIITLKDYKKTHFKDEIEVKINIHTTSSILYKIDYFNIKNKKIKGKIYYYDNNFYLEIDKILNNKDYLHILEQSEIIYEESDKIQNKGVKINI